MDTLSYLRGNLTLDNTQPFISACLTDSGTVAQSDLDNVEQLAAYLDGTYFIIRHLLAKLKEVEKLDIPKPVVYFENVLQVMDLVLRPERKPSGFLGQQPKPKSDLARHARPSALRHLFTQVWVAFFNNQISDQLIVRAIMLLGDGRLQRLGDSRMIADHVILIFDSTVFPETASLSIPPTWSRAVSRTMLDLIHKGGLNYPRLYPRLYELLDESLLTCPEVGRFLDDMDLYLSSLNLSYAVLASFLKRLGQLAILGSARVTPSLLLLIRNALRRHSKCAFLIAQKKCSDKSDSAQSHPSIGDPYRWDPKNLESTGATESSLWEVASLVHHHSPLVSALAQEICHPRVETSQVESITPSKLIQQQDEAISTTVKSVEKRLLTLAQSNVDLPVLPDLEGWVS